MRFALIVLLFILCIGQSVVISNQSNDNIKLNKENSQFKHDLKVADNVQFDMQQDIEKLFNRLRQKEEYIDSLEHNRNMIMDKYSNRILNSADLLEKIEKCNATTYLATRCLKDVNLHKFISNSREGKF